MPSPKPDEIVVIGAGPAGLTAAYELTKRKRKVRVLEKSSQIGGISRTETYRGYRFDIGGHRFFTKVPEVQQMWEELLGEAFQKTPRLSRIYYQGKFFQYPLEPREAFRNLGATESLLLALSYLRWRIAPYSEETTFEHWVTNRFGARLYEKFFKTYTEKVWGIPCNQIRADWAAQRIRNFSLWEAVLHAITGKSDAATLIKEFHYPTLGPGMMWERCADLLTEQGVCLQTEANVVAIHHDNGRVSHVETRTGEKQSRFPLTHLLATMPVSELLQSLNPAPPEAVVQAARALRYRDFIVVGLIINAPELFPDNWLYIHAPNVRVGRIQNFKNWSRALCPLPETTHVGLEYFCTAGDDLWEQADADLISLAKREMVQLGLAQEAQILDGVVFRQPKAYPVYDENYRQNLEVIRTYLEGFENLQTFGRNGLHRYNNQDHSMLSAMLAVRNIEGERHDLWNVNTERSYLEDYPSET